MSKDVFKPVNYNYQNKPVKAILYLLKEKKGSVKNAIFIPEIGFVDFVWGENNSKNKGFGLKHILEKHEKDFNKSNFKIEFVIPFLLLYGKLNIKKSVRNKVVFENTNFRIVIKVIYNNKRKKFLLTAFKIKKPLCK